MKNNNLSQIKKANAALLERGETDVMVWREMITSRFKDGLIAEEWFITDLAEQLLFARKVLANEA